MGHESSPKQREQELQFNKFVLDSYVPVLRDIASSNSISGHFSDEEHKAGRLYQQSVVFANGDYYAVSVVDVPEYEPGYGGPLSNVEIVRLLYQKDETPYTTLRSYSYDTRPSTRVIITRTAKVNEQHPGHSLDTSSIDDPKETLLLLGQFATMDDSGEVLLTCDGVDAQEAAVLMQKHTAERERLLKKITLLKKQRAPRLKKGLLDRMLGSDENSSGWY